MSTSIIGIDDHDGRRMLESKLAGWWAAALGVSRVGIDEDLFLLGCDPERGAIVLGRIRHELKIEIPVSDLFEARTVSKLADLIEIRQSSMDAASIIPIRHGGNRTPLFLVHGVGGNLLGFVNLVRSLDADQPVYGIQAQSLQSSGPILIQLEAMAAYYIRELRQIQPAGPYAFLGLSFGGLVAYEMAQQLTASGETVSLLGMLDTWQPGYMSQLRTAAAWPHRIWERLRLVLLNTKKLSLRQTLRYGLGRIKGRVLRAMYVRMGKGGVSLPNSMRRVRDINLMAGARYMVRPYAGAVTLFRALDCETPKLPEDLGWRAHAQGGVEIIRLPGDHGQVLSEPNASYLARALTECLNRPREPFVAAPAARADFELDGAGEERPDAGVRAMERGLSEVVFTGEPGHRASAWQPGRILIDHLVAIPEPRLGTLSELLSGRKPPRGLAK